MSAEQLTVGPELDMLVAQKVFGWKWDEKRCRACGGTIVPHPDFPGCWIDNCSMRPIPKDEERADAILNYSGDIKAAWSVVEHLRAQGYVVAVVTCRSGWACDIGPGDMSYLDMMRGYGEESAPLAICRAALQAVGA